MVVVGKDKQGGVREHSVFGGEGRPPRFGLFTMSEFGTTRLAPVKAAESKVEKAARRGLEVKSAIRLLISGEPDISAREVLRRLRDDDGLTFDDKDARAWLREVRAE